MDPATQSAAITALAAIAGLQSFFSGGQFECAGRKGHMGLTAESCPKSYGPAGTKTR